MDRHEPAAKIEHLTSFLSVIGSFLSVDNRTGVLHLSNMQLKWLTTRELVARPGAVLKALPQDGAALLTTNGKPRALLLPVNEATFLEDVTAIIGYLAEQGAQRARAKAVAKRRDQMSDDAIDAVIAKTRATRHVVAR